jgi:heme-degrading monooxygenase HmoA
MIVEQTLLHIRDGQAEAFESAMQRAVTLISASPGFRGIEVRPASEEQNLYLLIVRWDDIASHRNGFRLSARYKEWRDILHGFYDPMPTVRYFGDSILNV